MAITSTGPSQPYSAPHGAAHEPVVGAGLQPDGVTPYHGGRPANRVALRITEQLRDLKPGVLLCVAVDGTLHRGKSVFLHGHAEPLVSFIGTDNGSVSVYPGLPPRNPTFCGSAGSQDKRPLKEGPELIYSVVLKSGDTLQLCETPIRIPNRLLSRPRTAEEKLAQLLGIAPVGAEVQLGRLAVPECPGEVSRIHCTATILERRDEPDGTFSLKVRVVPGIPAKEPIAIQHANGVREPIPGMRTVARGSQVFLGERLGTVTIPYPAGSIEEASESICQSFIGGQVEFARRALATFQGPENGAFTEDRAGMSRVSPASGLDLVRGRTLQRYICKGIELICAGRHEEAIKHFRTSDVLKTLGYCFQENNLFGLNSLDAKAVLDNLTDVASRSWFRVADKLVYPSFGVLKTGLAPQNEQEERNLAHWRKEIALLYAEEYTHALQDALGGLVSRKAALLERPDHEADVALFLREQGVNLSNEFVINRYSERRDALRLSQGFQRPETQQLFQEALAGIPLGGTLCVGRGPTGAGAEEVFDPVFSIPPVDVESGVGSSRAAVRAHGALEAVEAMITKRQDGSFVVRANSDKSTLFVPDSAGYYSRAVAGREYVLEPNTPIYIGRAFKLKLREG